MILYKTKVHKKLKMSKISGRKDVLSWASLDEEKANCHKTLR